MSKKTMLANVEGWTPVIDHLVSEFSITTALVFGVVWRYCQRYNHVCYASQDVLAAHIGITRQALNKHLAKLVEAKYLEDMTPDRANRPHTYKDTGKANLRIAIIATVNQDDSTVNQDDSTVNDVDTNTLSNTQSSTPPNGKHRRLKPTPPAAAGDGNDITDNSSSDLELAQYKRLARHDAKAWARKEFGPKYNSLRFRAACEAQDLYLEYCARLGKYYTGGQDIIAEFYDVLGQPRAVAIDWLRQKGVDIPDRGPLVDYFAERVTV